MAVYMGNAKWCNASGDRLLPAKAIGLYRVSLGSFPLRKPSSDQPVWNSCDRGLEDADAPLLGRGAAVDFRTLMRVTAGWPYTRCTGCGGFDNS